MKFIPKFVIEDDDMDLLWRFTDYISQVAGFARREYLRKPDYRKREIPLEQAPADALSYEDQLPASKDDFDFEEGRLAKSFSKLKLLRRQILTLIYVEGLPAPEVAERLNCSVDYVYKQKHRAIKKLRDQLMNGGDERGE